MGEGIFGHAGQLLRQNLVLDFIVSVYDFGVLDWHANEMCVCDSLPSILSASWCLAIVFMLKGRCCVFYNFAKRLVVLYGNSECLAIHCKSLEFKVAVAFSFNHFY